jgi:hypothetical protein
MSKQYSQETIIKLKERFVCRTKWGRNTVWDAKHDVEVSNVVFLDSAASIQQERLKWQTKPEHVFRW